MTDKPQPTQTETGKKEVTDSVRKRICSQVEYYLSTKNLLKDDFLMSNMDEDLNVSISLLATFPALATLLSTLSPTSTSPTALPALISSSLTNSTKVIVSSDGLKIRPKVEPAPKNILILKGIQATVDEETILGLFPDSKETIESAHPDVVDTWRITFSSEEAAKAQYEALKKKTLEGKPVSAELRRENPRNRLQSLASDSAVSAPTGLYSSTSQSTAYPQAFPGYQMPMGYGYGYPYQPGYNYQYGQNFGYQYGYPNGFYGNGTDGAFLGAQLNGGGRGRGRGRGGRGRGKSSERGTERKKGDRFSYVPGDKPEDGDDKFKKRGKQEGKDDKGKDRKDKRKTKTGQFSYSSQKDEKENQRSQTPPKPLNMSDFPALDTLPANANPPPKPKPTQARPKPGYSTPFIQYTRENILAVLEALAFKSHDDPSILFMPCPPQLQACRDKLGLTPVNPPNAYSLVAKMQTTREQAVIWLDAGMTDPYSEPIPADAQEGEFALEEREEEADPNTLQKELQDIPLNTNAKSFDPSSRKKTGPALYRPNSKTPEDPSIHLPPATPVRGSQTPTPVPSSSPSLAHTPYLILASPKPSHSTGYTAALMGADRADGEEPVEPQEPLPTDIAAQLNYLEVSFSPVPTQKEGPVNAQNVLDSPTANRSL
ncbi:hypothetical protein BLNAU_3776 [Blattamonas nauphoetae]|uniref:HTH La-type RNA-binding domain-containing protein n=1 Tax=Blattamonas nauphoetae TaxID=2049346 RepID=A0ABQ9YC46_9EUKA|nr:hypothetical protein BLNAU_3776 [Blattamonas nauphoetae]